MKFYIFLCLYSLLLTGCGEMPPSFNPSEKDEETGIQIERLTDVNYSLESVVIEYKKVEACMGLSAVPGPNIIITDSASRFTGIPGINGFTYYSPPLIVIDDLSLRNNNTLLLQHEFVHYILLMNGFEDSKNTNHESYLFFYCGDTIY